MSERTRQGLHVIAAALLLGVLGDALLRATPWGLNFFLWTGAGLAAAVALLERWRRAALKGDGGWLLLPLILFAAAFAWRDSPTLKWLDALTVACAFGLLAWRASGASIKLAGLGEYARGLARAGLQTMGGTVPLIFSDVPWGEIPRNGLNRPRLAHGASRVGDAMMRRSRSSVTMQASRRHTVQRAMPKRLVLRRRLSAHDPRRVSRWVWSRLAWCWVYSMRSFSASSACRCVTYSA